MVFGLLPTLHLLFRYITPINLTNRVTVFLFENQSPTNLPVMNTSSKLIRGFREFRSPILRFTLLIVGLLILMQVRAQIGNVCETPLQISSLPYSHSGNTATYGNDYDYFDIPEPIANPVSNGSFATYYIGSNEVVYAYTPPQNGFVNASLLGNGDLSALWVFTGCPFATTVGWSLFFNNAERHLNSIPVMAGTTYYFVISSYPNNPSINYTFELEVGSAYDCPDLQGFIGNPCDDNDPTTINDQITDDCECEGISINATANFMLPTSLECGLRYVQVQLYEVGTNSQIFSGNTYSFHNMGSFSLSNFPIGTFDMYVKVDGMLRLKYGNFTSNSGLNTINITNAQVGDLNDNNSINITDVSLFASYFGTTVNSPNYNHLANLNCDQGVNVLDLSLLGQTFGLQGAALP